MNISKNIPIVVTALALSWFSSLSQAHPYATGITNNSGTIQFTLNESADNVSVRFDNNTSTNNLGALGAGPQSFLLTTHTNFSIVVFKAGSGTPSQLSSDTNNFVKFNSPRGIAINTNGGSQYFGRVYVANSAAGTTSGRAVGDGIYLLNADLTDAVAQGNTALTGGISFAGGSSAPFKLGVGKDNNLYINDFSTAAAMTWQVDPNVTLGSSNQIFAGIGEFSNPTVHTDSASTPLVTGSLAAGNLTVYMTDGAIAPFNSMLRWDIGAGPLPWNTPPSAVLGNAGIPSVADLTTDMDIGKDGKFYTSINRSGGTDVNSVKVFDTDGVTFLWGSLDVGGSPDPLRQTRAIMVSPDGKYLACVHDDNHVSVLPLISGIPDLASMFTLNFPPTTTIGRDMGWDAANNIYTVSSGQALLRVYSLGLTTTAITSNDSTGTNGSFQITSPANTVSVVASTPNATEAGAVAAVFTITRSDTDTANPLIVTYTLSGLATNGTDYTLIPTTVTIAAGQLSTNITITPVDDSISELTETVILTVKGGASYSAVSPSTATAFIADNDAQVLQISLANTNMYERITNDYIGLRITRLGDLNAASYTLVPANYTYAGTAVANADFVPVSQTVSFDPGIVDITNNITPLNNNLFTGNKTVIAGLSSGAGFTASANLATGIIIDDENPPESTLFDDPLTSDSSALWHTNFMANNLIDDYFVQFGYPLATDVISTAPSGATTALKLTVNKNDPTANGAAGINLYPNGYIFSNNFALRFSMCLIQNPSAGTTEYVTFGINHSGLKTNWIPAQSGDTVNNTSKDNDGFWASVVADASGSAPADYVLWRGNGAANGPFQAATASASSFTKAFKNPPYSAGGGSGSPGSLGGSADPIWSDLEMKKINNTITVAINKTVVLSLTNATNYSSGNIMLGYCDPYASIGDMGAVYYSNVRVVNLAPRITSVSLVGANVVIVFTTPDGTDTAASFVLQSSTTVAGTYTDVSPAATITQLSPGVFQAVKATSGPTQFYRIRHL